MNISRLHLDLGAASSSGFNAKAVSLSDVTAQITPTSVTSPVSTAAKVSQATKTTLSMPEPDIAFPAVLKGSQKQRVPPPVPPRGSPKAKRGGHQPTFDSKGDFNFSVDADDNFVYGHDYNFKDIACHVPLSDTIDISKLNTLEGIKPPNLFAQSNMMAKFDMKDAMRHQLDGDYDDKSFTDSSSDEEIIIEELKDVQYDKVTNVKTTKSRYQFFKFSKKSPTPTPIKVEECIYSESEDEMPPVKKPSTSPIEREISEPVIAKIEKPEKPNNRPKQGLMSGLSKKFPFTQSKKEKKVKPKIEIKTYTEEHGERSRDEAVCREKAKTQINMFQKNILKSNTESECSSITSMATHQVLKSVQHTNVDQKKEVFEKKAVKPRPGKRPAPKPPVATLQLPKPSNVTDKIRKFSVTVVPENRPPKTFGEIKRSSFKRLSDRKIFRMRKEFEVVL
ncbi:unnamed protein product [Leptosia nina]|uniref:Uncharacterized protein n=1 Tax=Leptosia nina TaxID=320188 RepID=A0AAV1JJ66_9NEOP